MLRLSALPLALVVVFRILVGMGDVQNARVSLHELSSEIRALVNSMRR